MDSFNASILFETPPTSFVNGNIRGMQQWLTQHSPQSMQDDPVSKRQYIDAILEGEPLSAQLEQRLGYAFEKKHLACVIWTTNSDAQMSQLELIKEKLLEQLQAHSHLSIIAGSATLWLWCQPNRSLDYYHMTQQLQKMPHIRVGIGSLTQGIDGFRHSHFEALTVQRLMARLASPTAIVAIEQARLISLVTQDLKTAQHFIHQVLGKFIHAESILHHSARLYIQHSCNTSVAAQHLFVHRNTLIRRLEQINQMLPKPLEQNLLDIGIALEMMSWLSPESII